MKRLSETLKELGIAFTFPIKVKDFNGKLTYYEDCTGYWRKSEYDSNGNKTYFETSNGYWQRREYDENGNRTYYETSNAYWCKKEYDSNGNETYFEDSDGNQRGNPPRSQTCEGKVIEVDGIKYELKLK